MQYFWRENNMAMSEQLDAIQRFIISKHREMFCESPSPMKLQKLCYYAQGFMLAQGDGLFSDDFQAWQHGPVIPDLFQKYRDYKWHAIDEEVIPLGIDADIAREVSDIVAAYGRYDGAALSTMTHREAPWKDARGDIPESDGSTVVITKDSMRTYFGAKLSQDGQ